MIKLEDILEMWKKDSIINKTKIDDDAIETSKLHAKYLELLMQMKLLLKRKEMNQKHLLKDKWLYYTGKMTKAEMDEKGWVYDPFNGLKVMKSDIQYYYETDVDLQKSEAAIDYTKALVDTLSQILEHIKWRHQQLKVILDWNKFTSGV